MAILAKLALLALAAAGLLAGCGGDSGDKTFEGDGFSFTYPGDWEEAEATGFTVEPKAGSVDVVGPPGGSANAVLVTSARLPGPVTEENLGEFSAVLAPEVDRLFQRAQGGIANPPTRISVGGLPALRFDDVSAVNPEGTRTHSRLIFVFNGRNQYFLNCQYTPSGAEEIESGCDQLVESFKVE